ncbi:MAG: peptidase [Magnetococcales bacterium]|nr:peptidase [Magnetococcales bacterium]
MTYCVGIQLNEGMILASDSRTNAGVDQVGSYPKMFTFVWKGERQFVLLSSGNLATTQAVVHRLFLDSENPECKTSLRTVVDMHAAADYLGSVSLDVQKRSEDRQDSSVRFEATFILAGQIGSARHAMFLIYPEGNHIAPSPYHPFLQIGETKYGKPILDRIVHVGMSIDDATRCALVSLDSTMRSNLTVGPPIDLLMLHSGQLDGGTQARLGQDNPYLLSLCKHWHKGLERIFHGLPPFNWEKLKDHS